MLALISVAAAVYWSVKWTSAAWAPTVLALIMLLMAFGGPVWDWSKWSGGSGLSPTVRSASFAESQAVTAFLWATIGAALSSLAVPRTQEIVRTGDTWSPSRKISIAIVTTATISLIGFLLGQGPSIVRKPVYGEFDGNAFILRVFWPSGLIVGLICLALIAVEKNRRLRLLMLAVAALWFLATTVEGSRTAVAFPIVGAMLIIHHEISRRRLHLPMIAAAFTLLATAVVVFSISLLSRSIPHGILNLPNVVGVTLADARASTDSYLYPLKQLASSVFVSFPIAEQSATYEVGLDVLVANANALPGTAQPAELERYWPYEWVPLSFAGTWFDAAGWIGQFLLFGAIGWMSGKTAHNLQRSQFQTLWFVPIYTAAMIGALSAQYSSRMVWRLVSIAAFLFFVSFLLRRTRQWEGLHNGDQGKGPPEVPDDGARSGHSGRLTSSRRQLAGVDRT
ncbi:hypothetical protein H7J88_23280 [Mycolicibacterium flavescens]|uniref:hypothetical protein n=1 Tax=Mycolicibacterium flavescens TaxID=1776 RepID=UPI0010422769|nr:hypothetical protein [Mycolicibacterium flavescens]MCV7282562.1 hypothetical protein [Mycolicibacterium flavescens]